MTLNGTAMYMFENLNHTSRETGQASEIKPICNQV